MDVNNRNHYTFGNWPLNNPWVKEIVREIKKYLELSKNGNIAYLNLWNITKEVLTEKFIALNA